MLFFQSVGISFIYVGMTQVKSHVIRVKTATTSARTPTQGFKTNPKSLTVQYPNAEKRRVRFQCSARESAHMRFHEYVLSS